MYTLCSVYFKLFENIILIKMGQDICVFFSVCERLTAYDSPLR